MNILLKSIPLSPGIYLMKDDTGKVIYVGKAKSLKKRVSQYFLSNTKTLRIQSMVSKISSIEYIVTKNELEALVLECNYIKQYLPKYNVLLKDDKTYPYIKINIRDKFPEVILTRQKKDDGSIYYGPYTDVSAVRENLKVIREIFPLKRCKYNLNKPTNNSVGPCLYYHIDRCLGPCINDNIQTEYKEMLKQVMWFLEGRTKALEKSIKEDIQKYIDMLDFEKANILKTRLESIQKLSDKQSASNVSNVDMDIWGYILENQKLYIQIFKARDSKISTHDKFEIKYEEKEVLSYDLFSIIAQYYSDLKVFPKEVCISLRSLSDIEKERTTEEIEILNKYLSQEAGKTVKIITPKKGSKQKLIQMVENNILARLIKEKENPLKDLSDLLGLDKKISSIEAYDISNLRNEYIVGAMITYENSKLKKSKYRKFKIRSTLTQNDTLSLAEVIKRRLGHLQELPIPDAMFIDGGKGQLKAVNKILKKMNISVLVLGMVKNDKHRTEKILTSDGEEFNLKTDPKNKTLLNFITFIQDEVHRFTINYHRNLRDKVK